MGQLGQAGDNVADGEDARLLGLHPLVDLDEAAFHFDFGVSRPMLAVRGARPTATNTVSASFTTCLPSAAGEGDLHAVLGLLYLVHLGAGVGVDAALAKDARQFLAHVLVFVGDHARQVFDDGDLAAKALEDGAEFDPYGAGADHHHGLGYLGQGENLHVGQDAVASDSTPGNMRASEPVAITTFFRLDHLLLAVGASTEME